MKAIESDIYCLKAKKSIADHTELEESRRLGQSWNQVGEK